MALLTTFAPAAPVAAQGAAAAWPTHPHWQQYVVAPSSADVTPVRIVRASGDVKGAPTMTVRDRRGQMSLTMEPGGAEPTVVVDYGRDVGGDPYFNVKSQNGSPVLRASYSEGLQYIGPDGDNSPSTSGASDSSRFDTFTVNTPGRLTNGLIQGGERYEQISLTSPGSVDLSSLGIDFTADRATAGDYRGWFDSSSAELNRIWYDGAYTTQLDELPPGTVPGAWNVAGGSMVDNGGFSGVLKRGSRWSNYTAAFDTRIEHDDAGWVVRSNSSLTGYVFFLDGATDTTGPPDSLREYAISPTALMPIGTVHLHSTVPAGRWLQISTVADGSHISTSLDGHRIATIAIGSLPPGAAHYRSGSFGFVEYHGQEARFKDLRVTGPGQSTLFDDTLSGREALADFTGPNVASGEFRPAILDGAKRDREVWSGDLGVEGPTVYYSTNADDYIKDSLQLLGSYQSADGEAAGSMSPVAALGTYPESGATYSASYSMDEVDNIATYYLYSGDLPFVRAEWPVISRELAYNRSLLDSRGLLATNSVNGMDWDYYDGSKSGEVTAYNVIYYETLDDAATMATALGMKPEAATLRHQAATLRSAINRYLFNPGTGLYETSNLMPGSIAQDANSLSVVGGVAGRGVDGSVVTALEKSLPTTPYGPLPFSNGTGYRAAVSPFVTNEEVQAEFDSGDSATALALIEQLWGYMDAPGPDYTGADWELVGENGTPGFGDFTSLAHGWSSGPTADLSAYVLGVRPTGAGYRSWVVQPHPGGLSWVEGDVLTPAGTIAVRWAQQAASGRFTLQVGTPGHTAGTISVPVPPTGAVVTLSASRGAKPLRTIDTRAGDTYQSIPVAGGRTYFVNVVPRAARQ